MHSLRIGCSGWQYASWRGPFYPPGLAQRRWLGRYAECFTTVEVNATFYRLARRSAVEGWVRDTPNHFLFTVKASRFLTHVKRLADIEDGIRRFYEPLEPLRESGRLGPTLWQLPATFRCDLARLDGWLELLPSGRHTIEFRHPSWFVPAVIDRLRYHGVALTLADHPDRRYGMSTPTADFAFVRFHYGTHGRRGNYSVTELTEWGSRLAAWRRERDVFAYFNNDWEAFAPRNARALVRNMSA